MLRTICFIKKDNSAFTMIELLVVIAVLGILASIAVPRMSGVTERARLAVDQAAVRNLNSVTSVYRSSKHSDPFIDQANTNQSLLQILADNDYIPDNFEPQSENIEFAWLFEEERWSLFSLSGGGAFLTLDDLVDNYIHTDGEYTGVLGFRPGNHTRYAGNATEIFIPNEIDDQEISGIYQRFFKEKNLSSVSFEAGSEIKKIHNQAFRSNNLEKMELPQNLEEIHWSAFRDNNLIEINLPASLNKIAGDAFNGNDLAKITIASSGVDIGDYAFGDNTDQFREEYENNGAGTYIWDGENWIKE